MATQAKNVQTINNLTAGKRWTAGQEGVFF
jgi:hypothetical protein